MKVLIACEESQTVCKSFREKGHEAYSCDILDCSGGKPEWHIKGDAISALYSQKWDLVIAHPPCTRLANSGVSWLVSKKERVGYKWNEELKIYASTNASTWMSLRYGIEFFKAFLSYGKAGNKIAIENPIPHKYAREGFVMPFKNNFFTAGIESYTCTIQPYMFGHPERKATCLWLFGLPNLSETDNVFMEMKLLPKNEQQRIHYLPPSKDRAKLRSKTFEGIAKAMADQWS